MQPEFRPQRPLDAPIVTSTPTSPQRLAVLNTALTLAQAVIVAYFGWALTGRVDMALKERQTVVQERQMTVTNVDKMASLLKSINDAGIDEVERARSVAQLSMYGSDALFPAFVMAIGRSPVAPTDAIWALRVLAVQRRGEVCELLNGALGAKSLINEIRKAAVRELADDLKCPLLERAP